MNTGCSSLINSCLFAFDVWSNLCLSGHYKLTQGMWEHLLVILMQGSQGHTLTLRWQQVMLLCELIWTNPTDQHECVMSAASQHTQKIPNNNLCLSPCEVPLTSSHGVCAVRDMLHRGVNSPHTIQTSTIVPQPKRPYQQESSSFPKNPFGMMWKIMTYTIVSSLSPTCFLETAN